MQKFTLEVDYTDLTLLLYCISAGIKDAGNKIDSNSDITEIIQLQRQLGDMFETFHNAHLEATVLMNSQAEAEYGEMFR